MFKPSVVYHLLQVTKQPLISETDVEIYLTNKRATQQVVLVVLMVLMVTNLLFLFHLTVQVTEWRFQISETILHNETDVFSTRPL